MATENINSDSYALESTSTASVSKALAAAQGDIKAPKKGRTAKVRMKSGGEYSYSYADLADVIDCLKDPFAKHGLSQSQAMRSPNGHIEIVTTIRHESGEWIRSYYPLPNYATPQEMGSAISYGRRYSLTALAGIMAEDDDDGQRAQDGAAEKRSAKTALTKPTTAEAAPADPLTNDEKLHLIELGQGLDMKREDWLKLLQDHGGGVSGLNSLDRANLGAVIEELRRRGAEADAREIFHPVGKQ